MSLVQLMNVSVANGHCTRHMRQQAANGELEDDWPFGKNGLSFAIHNIDEDIGILEFQALVRKLYTAWRLGCLSVVLNVVLMLCDHWFEEKTVKTGSLLWCELYAFCGSVIAWKACYRPMYNTYRLFPYRRSGLTEAQIVDIIDRLQKKSTRGVCAQVLWISFFFFLALGIPGTHTFGLISCFDSSIGGILKIIVIIGTASSCLAVLSGIHALVEMFKFTKERMNNFGFPFFGAPKSGPQINHAEDNTGLMEDGDDGRYGNGGGPGQNPPMEQHQEPAGMRVPPPNPVSGGGQAY